MPRRRNISVFMRAFSDGTSGTVNLRSDIFSAGEMTRPLREPAYFNRLKIGQFGDVVWPNGFDFCPDSLYLKIIGKDSRRFHQGGTVIFTTTPSVEGKAITRYHGVIAGEAIMGVNIFKDLFAGIRDIIGGRAGSYEKELEKARTVAFEDIGAKAREVGADAVVGIDIDYEVIGGSSGSMLMVSVSGTAVSLR